MEARGSIGDAALADIVEALAGPGWWVCDGLIPADLLPALQRRACELQEAGVLRRAGIGRAGGHRLAPEFRRDRICWISPQTSDRAERAYLMQAERLRRMLNRELMLGLFDLEVHFALYAPGSFYRRHLDRFSDDDRRTVTLITYLNTDWRPDDGGALRLYVPANDGERAIDILPLGGRSVIFLSDRFPHEVLPCHRHRWSLTGWFRRRSGPLPGRR